eukprot:EG_transcript_27661
MSAPPFGANAAFEAAVAAAPPVPVPAPERFSPHERDYRWALPSEGDLYLQRLERRLARLHSKGVVYAPPPFTEDQLAAEEEEEDEEDLEREALLPRGGEPPDWEEDADDRDGDGGSAAAAQPARPREAAAAAPPAVPYGVSKRKYYSVTPQPPGWFEWLVQRCRCLCCSAG